MKSKSELRRIMFIHRQIKSGVNPNSKQLAAQYEVADRTIKRDIEYMREFLDAPIVSSGENKGYSYTQEFYNLPLLMMGKGEFMALILLEQILPNFDNSPFAKQLSIIKNKLFDIMPNKIAPGLNKEVNDEKENNKEEKDKHPGNILGVTLQSDPLSIVDLTLWESLLSGLHDNQILQITYQSKQSSLEEKSAVTRRVHPYRIIGDHGAWYLLAYDESKGEVRIFSLSRIKKIELLKESFEEPEGFRLEDYIDSHFGVFISDKKIEVELGYDSEIAQLIEERVWHPTQEIIEHSSSKNKENKDRKKLRFVTNQKIPLIKWILSWGEHITVLKPMSLRQEIKATLEKSLKNY